MKYSRLNKLKILIAALAIRPAGVALGDVIYPDPAGGWTYMFTADVATAGPADNYDSLEGTWDHANGSDAWGRSQIGSGSSSPSRKVPADYDNDPENWTAGAPSPVEQNPTATYPLSED